MRVFFSIIIFIPFYFFGVSCQSLRSRQSHRPSAQALRLLESDDPEPSPVSSSPIPPSSCNVHICTLEFRSNYERAQRIGSINKRVLDLRQGRTSYSHDSTSLRTTGADQSMPAKKMKNKKKKLRKKLKKQDKTRRPRDAYHQQTSLRSRTPSSDLSPSGSSSLQRSISTSNLSNNMTTNSTRKRRKHHRNQEPEVTIVLTPEQEEKVRIQERQREEESFMFCSLLSTFGTCIRERSSGCRGSLEYHSLQTLVRRYSTYHKCLQDHPSYHNLEEKLSREREQSKLDDRIYRTTFLRERIPSLSSSGFNPTGYYSLIFICSITVSFLLSHKM